MRCIDNAEVFVVGKIRDVACPLRRNVCRARPDADAKTSKERSTTRSGFAVNRSYHRHLQLVGLELHEKGIVGGSTIGT